MTPAALPRVAFSALGSILFALALLPATQTMAQTSSTLQASDIDWITWENLTPEQQAEAADNCCGRYIEPALTASDANTGSTVIRATTLEGDSNGIVTVTNGLQVLRQNSEVSALQGTYDQNRRFLTLEQNIRIRQPGMLLTGASAEIDEVAATSELHDASYVLHESGMRGTAEIIVYKDAQGIITIDNGVFTRCEPGNNSWLIEGEEIELNQSTGRGTARSVTLKVKDVPVMYLPWVSFPINDNRATGFLAPVIGSTRDGGFDFSAPFYVNLAPNYDLTLTPRLQTQRGVMLAAEGRYRGQRHEQVLDLQFLPDDDLYNPATANIPGSNSPPVSDRWMMNYAMQGSRPGGWSTQVIYAAVSDDEYFQDLGTNGMFSTAQSFLRRDARVRYRTRNWNFTAAMQAFQLIDPTVPEIADPYRKLPELNLDGSFYTDWGLEYGVDSEYTRFDRNLSSVQITQAQLDAGLLVQGSRLAVTPVVSFPWANSYAFATPTLKYKYASWDLDDQALGKDSSPSRSIASGSFDTGLIFERDMDLFGNDLRQTLEPRLFYLYNQYEDQSDIPLFDSSELTFSYNQLFRDDRFSGKDRVGDANQLTLAVSSRFYDSKGQERVRASIGQIQYFTNRRVSLLNIPGQTINFATSAMVGELAVNLGSNWRAGSYLEWNTGTSAVDVGNFQFQYQSDINRILNFGYRYRVVPGPATINGIERQIDQIDISGIWPLNSQWGLIGRWNHDLANTRNLETIAGVEYSNCCWTMRLLARHWIDNNDLFEGIEDDNTGVFIQFELKGLGSLLGGNVSGILNNGISGYRERDYVR